MTTSTVDLANAFHRVADDIYRELMQPNLVHQMATPSYAPTRGSPLGRAIARERKEERKWIALQRKAERMGLGMRQRK